MGVLLQETPPMITPVQTLCMSDMNEAELQYLHIAWITVGVVQGKKSEEAAALYRMMWPFYWQRFQLLDPY